MLSTPAEISPTAGLKVIAGKTIGPTLLELRFAGFNESIRRRVF